MRSMRRLNSKISRFLSTYNQRFISITKLGDISNNKKTDHGIPIKFFFRFFALDFHFSFSLLFQNLHFLHRFLNISHFYCSPFLDSLLFKHNLTYENNGPVKREENKRESGERRKQQASEERENNGPPERAENSGPLNNKAGNNGLV